MAEVSLKVGPGGWQSSEVRERLECGILPGFLPRQRWFAGKARTIDTVRLADLSPGIGDGGRFALALFEVRFQDGGSDFYLLPLCTTRGDETSRIISDPRWYIASLEDDSGKSALHDAMVDPEACLALIDLIAREGEIPMQRGTVRALRTGVFEQTRGSVEALRPVRVGSAEQSNTTVFYGDRLILKVFRRLEPGQNPDFEIGRFLTERAHFAHAPQVAGAIEYHQEGQPAMTLAILQGLVQNQGSGWEGALKSLADFYRVAAKHPDQPPDYEGFSTLDLAAIEPPDSIIERLGDALRDAATLGRRTAELHQALASDDHDPDFAPLPLTNEDLSALAAEIREQVEQTLSALRETRDRLSEAERREADQVLGNASGWLAQTDRLSQLNPGSNRIRIHGDYHLGQVLRTDHDFVILDFEGEPARGLEQRRARQSPIKDVVGMLRSFDYAAHAGLFNAWESRPDHEREHLTPWARAWRDWTASRFLRSYLEVAGSASFLPRDRGDLQELLKAFTLDKAMYELLYELNNRPDWVRIPLRGIISLI